MAAPLTPWDPSCANRIYPSLFNSENRRSSLLVGQVLCVSVSGDSGADSSRLGHWSQKETGRLSILSSQLGLAMWVISNVDHDGSNGRASF